MVLEDVLDDFTTIELAREAYGVVISEGLEIDEAATEALRKKLRGERGARLPGRAADARLDAASAGDLALREGDVTDDAAYGVYGRGTVEPGDRPAILVVDYQKAFTTDGLGLGGSPLIERGVVNAARLLRVARETGRARVPVPRLVRRGRGRPRAVEPQGAELGEITAGSPLGRDRRARLRPVRLAAWPRSGRRSSPARRSRRSSTRSASTP